MEFIKQMKKREFIEMGLKTLAAVLAAFLAIILMEGMIYSIQLNALKTVSSTSTANSATTIAYCIPEDNDKYFVLYHNPDDSDDTYDWSATKQLLTKDECENLTVKERVYKAPNAFVFSITGTHYIVMAVFMAAVSGFFVYRFVRLNNEYKKIEHEYKTNGTISFTSIALNN